MIATLSALLFAHVLADFTLQTNWIATNKHKLSPLALHGAIVFATAVIATGSTNFAPLLALTLAHVVIDAIKAHGFPGTGLAPFLIDQATHLATLVATALLFPGLWDAGLWADYDWLLPLMTVASGLILTTGAGGYAVGFLMAPLAPPSLPEGLQRGGKIIGLLERGLVFLLVIVGQPTAIGFLIAAKSVLRFDTTSKDQTASEYVIIGTLASFGWALSISYATITWLTFLPDLGIAQMTP